MTRHELMELHRAPPVRGLGDLTPTENVWVASAGYGDLFGQPAHRRASYGVAVCGAAIAERATSAEHMVVLSGRLCPACWPIETPAGNGPAEMEA